MLDEQDAPFRNLITYRLARVQARLNAQATQILRENGGLTLTQWRILVLLVEYNEATVAKLTRVTQFDKALISRNVHSMVRDGLILSKLHPDDHRQHVLSLTPDGRAKHDQAAPYMQERQAALATCIDADEKDAFLSILDRLEASATS